MFARIAGTGSYLPATIVTNDELAGRMIPVTKWIATAPASGSGTWLRAGEQTSDLALAASHGAGRGRD